jgi:hypothetical protein
MARLSSEQSTQERAPAEKEKPRFSIFGGLKDRLGRSSPRKVLKLIRSAIDTAPEISEERMEKAAARFSELEQREKCEVLDSLEEMLDTAAEHCWESELRRVQVHNLAMFLSKSAGSIESMDDYEAILACLEQAATSDEAEKDSDAFRQMQSMALAALWGLGERDPECWENLLLSKKTRNLALDLMLDMGAAEKSEVLGWALLRKNLSAIQQSVISSTSQEKIPFLKSLIEGEDADNALMAFGIAIRIESRSGLLPAAEQIAMSDAVGNEIWVAATEFVHICKRLDEFGKGGLMQIEAANDLSGMIMGGMDSLRPVMMRRVSDLEENFSKASPENQLCSMMAMGLFSSVGVGRRGTDGELQMLVDSLLEKWEEAGVAALSLHAGRITIPIARSNSANRDRLIEKLFSSNELRMVRAAFNISINFENPEAANNAAARILEDGPDELKAEAKRFLEAMELIEMLDYADERQFEAAHRLIDLYLSNPAMLMTMVEILEGMEELVVEASEKARETGADVDVSRPMEVIGRLMGLGFMPGRLNIQYDVV